VHDKRETEVLGLSQGWNFQASNRHALKWGFELRAFDTRYDYDRSDHFDTPLALIRHDHDDEPTVFHHRFREKHNSLYVTDRMHLADPLTLELGLRYDGNSLMDENHLTPRFNLAWASGEASVFRFAWGRFNQSQRPYELQVEDGDTHFYPTERSEHRVLGFEKIFARGTEHGGVIMRAEAYQRRVRNPRPRYENLYEAINTFPEIEPDRVLIVPERSTARGFELYLQGRAGSRLGWWANYAYASTEDRVSGRDLPRKYDQTHTLNLDLDYRIGRHWRLNGAWRYHTGWPTTPLSAREEVNGGGETVYRPVLGPLYSERLPVYHRLDLRVSREFRAGRGTLVFFIDVQNAYNRKNLAGFDIQIDEEDGTIEIQEEYWAGILPSVGITYEF
jgi:outer membrane receptor protein involved in Fe transport